MVKTSNLMMLKILLVTNLPSVELKVPKLRLQTEIGISRKIKKKILDFTKKKQFVNENLPLQLHPLRVHHQLAKKVVHFHL